MSSCHYDRRMKLRLFYLKHVREARGRIGYNVIREICSYLPMRIELIQVTSAFLNTFLLPNLSTSQVSLSTSIRADHGSSWVILEKEGIFCCGGGSNVYAVEWKTAYLLSFEGTVQDLPPMSSARWCHGVIEFLGMVYVFGGGKRTCSSVHWSL